MPEGGSCLLGSINLSEFVNNDKTLNIDDLINVVDKAVIALNEVLDEGLELHPLREQRKSVRNWRQIGLGVFGISDMLIKMGIRYGSKESIDICDKIGFEIANQAIKTSAELDGYYNKMNLEAITNSNYFKENTSEETKELVKKCGLRNSQLLTIAPTGSLSSMLGVSGGIEPIFSNYYTRKTESLHGEDKYYKVYTPIVEKYMKENNINNDSDLPDYFVTARDLCYKERIDMQAIWQKHIDASISSTVNLPNETTVEEIEQLYLYAWEKGLKGVTIFRDGCKRTGILTTDEPPKEDDYVKATPSNIYDTFELPRGYIIDTSDDLVGYKRKLNTGCGSIHFEVYSDEFTGEPQETFVNIGSGGGCERNYQFISRLISLALRAGVPVESIIDQAMSIRPCKAYTDRTKSKGDTSKGTSCPSAIGHALKELQEKINARCFEDDEECESCSIYEDNEVDAQEYETPKCPECGEPLAFTGGCVSCFNCSYQKCE